MPERSNLPPRRVPDLETSRARLDLLDHLVSELATIKLDLTGFCTPESLRTKHPTFVLWGYLDQQEVRDLAHGTEFKPKAYAESLVLRKFGLTSRETLRSDRKKLRKARRTQSH